VENELMPVVVDDDGVVDIPKGCPFVIVDA
jgi:hypothetical protein